MFTKKKKIIILLSMFVLLVITGVLNIVLNNSTEATTNTSGSEYSASSFFTTCKADRISTRNETIELYNEILESEASSEEAKINAEEQINALLESMVMEVNMEGLIKAKGFSEALVNYSSTYINILIQSSELTETEVAQIVDIIQSQVVRDIDYIKIIPVE
ncbi:MAG: SpoIIIAH-like family protein [Clostridia bacterium]|nr:SpoIIIAH-like family protein [Clostridia bacterium]